MPVHTVSYAHVAKKNGDWQVVSKRVIYYHSVSYALLHLMLWHKTEHYPRIGNKWLCMQLINLMNIYNHLNTL